MASILCVGGPIRYMFRDGSGLTLDWMRANVVPGIHNQFSADPSNRVADVLSHAVLFAACQPGLEHLLPLGVGDRIRHAWTQVRPEDYHEDWNPIVRMPILVSRVENQLVIDDLMIAEPDGAPGPQQQQQIPHAQALHGHAAQLQLCLNQIHHCRQEVTEAKAAASQELSDLKTWLVVKFNTQALNLNKLRQAAHFAPAPNGGGGGGGAVVHQGFVGGGGIPAGDAAIDLENEHGPVRPNAVLTKGPKTIHNL